ncbi:Plasma membrane calcium-transporting ATPase 1 [Oryzias melastigma]|uniref:Plasma membrane calcium-transporting ATPase 1 n=1 Tax=Oryzias melastigma TaxID=30732 RepID=A0A834FGW8_ORYME|nr:Plasma membrane calcium-transporting ATPase 1 [Oryzias melastigma]
MTHPEFRIEDSEPHIPLIDDTDAEDDAPTEAQLGQSPERHAHAALPDALPRRPRHAALSVPEHEQQRCREQQPPPPGGAQTGDPLGPREPATQPGDLSLIHAPLFYPPTTMELRGETKG